MGRYFYALKAVVKDSFSNPVPGISVNFLAPASGASGSFQITLTCHGFTLCYGAEVKTDANGIATSPSFAADSYPGSYSVVATSPYVPGGSAVFSLINLPSFPQVPGPVTTVAHLPNCTANAIKVDNAGNIYLAGFQGTAPATNSFDAFVAKLSPDASQVLYFKTVSGSKYDNAIALDIDAAGAAYILGETESTDFPVTTGALQTKLLNPLQGFIVKVDSEGNLVYATLIGGDSEIHPFQGGLVIDKAGEAIASGQTLYGNFPATTGLPFTSTDTNTNFTLKLDSKGETVLNGIRGVGGRIATDVSGNVYLAGFQYGSSVIPITAGAFQSTHLLNACGGTGQLAFACSYQYVTKLSPDLNRILYSTYLTGSWGARPSAIGVDSQDNVSLAGTTNSPDYPTTTGSFQPSYHATSPPPPGTCLFGCVVPPNSSGYVTKLNATGTGLLYSTFFSGTKADTIDSAVIISDIGTFVSGSVGSPDLPGLENVPVPCLASSLKFATLFSPDGVKLTTTNLVPANILAYDAPNEKLLAWSGSDLISIDQFAPYSISCILDSADLRPVTAIAPGELLSIFGQQFVVEGAAVAVDGIPTPLLYASAQQVNIQVPYVTQTGSQARVDLLLDHGLAETNLSDSRTFPVIAMNPVVFLDPMPSAASGTCPAYSAGQLPLAYNSDGSRNTCLQPASVGSLVTLFLEGLGATTPTSFTLSDPSFATVSSASPAPGSLSGVWQITIRANQAGAIALSLFVDSVPVRDANLIIWAR